MTRSADYLYELLPVVYRMRDAEQGYGLRALLRVVGEQVNVVESDLSQLYENWFIETCADWVVPYLGDLLGYRRVSPPSAAEVQLGRASNKFLAPRREVAQTIELRRRKGTLSLLEDLANDVAGWPARALEFYRLLGWTQHTGHVQLARARTAELGNARALERLNTAFDDMAHTVDIRRPSSRRAPGRYNIPSVGVFVWRLRSYAVSHTQAYCVEKHGSQCYTFSALSGDTVLYTAPGARPNDTSTPELGVPAPISRRAFEQRAGSLPPSASPAYYGPGKSLSITALDWPARGTRGMIAAEDVIPADLSDWYRYRCPRNKVLVDPALGRMLFPAGQLPRGVWVRYHYGFSADLGGGAYARTLSQPVDARVYTVRRGGKAANEYRSIGAAYAQWQRDRPALDPERPELQRAAVIEIADSSVYEESLVFELDAGEYLQLRAAERTRPILRLIDQRADQPDPFALSGLQGSRFVLDGLLVAGRGIEVTQPQTDEPCALSADLCDVTIRHCTLVPGWDLDGGCEPKRPEEPSITLRYTGARLKVEHSITGAIWVIADERRADPGLITISDSIVDATRETSIAVADENGRHAFVKLSIARSTVIGFIFAHAIELAENSIFKSPVQVARRQLGCVRFCYLADGSRTARRYHCQPEQAAAAIAETMRQAAKREVRVLDPAALERAQRRERARVEPQFNSTRYGTAEYCQLVRGTADEILRGADDQAELGAFHDLFQSQRTANLRARLDEFTPAGAHACITYAT